MGPKEHLIVSGLTAAGCLMVFKEPLAAALCFGAGIGPDADHFLEYLIYCKGKWVKKEFWSGEYFEKKGSLYIMLHAYEYLLVIGTVLLILPKGSLQHKAFLISGMLGYGIHLLMDCIGNGCDLKTYSIIYRIMKKRKI